MTHCAWRIATEAPAYPARDLSGAGAASTGGRWNSIGTPMLYASTSIALATLETLAHLRAAELPLNRFLVRLDIADAVWARVQTLDPTGGWDALPCGRTSVEQGEAWIKGGKSALLLVPSVIVPEERNVLLNPAHSDAAGLSATTVRRFEYATIRR